MRIRMFRRVPSAIAPLVLATSILVATGCSVGPAAIRANHLNYNDAVRATTSEELLLNIVRIRYDDPTQWMSITTINSGFESEVGLGGSGGVSGATVSGGGTASLRFRDAPTITFTPRQGDELARQMLRPVSVTNMGYLSNAGWPFKWVSLLLIENIQGIGSFDVSTRYPIRGDSDRFFRLLEVIEQLQIKDHLVVGFLKYNDPWNDAPVQGSTVTAQSYIASAETGNVFVTDDGGKTFDYSSNDNEPMLMLRRSARDEPEMKELTKLLDLDPSRNEYLLARARTVETPTKERDFVTIRTRSFYGVLRLLSRGVHVHDEDIQAGICSRPTTGTPAAAVEHMLRGGFNVWVSNGPPVGASIAIPYRGRWFYIKDNDQISKQTFMLLSELFNLQISAGSSSGAPILTIPVGT